MPFVTRTRRRRGPPLGGGGTPAPTQRYFWTADSAVQGYVELSSDITIGSGEDFEHEFKFASTNTSTIQNLIGSTASDRIEIVFEGDGRVTVWMSGPVFTVSGINAYLDGALHTGILKRISNTVTLEIDGTPIGSGTTSAAGSIGLLGARDASGSVNPFDGVTADTFTWTDGDRVTGTLVLDMPLNEDGTTTVAANRADSNNNGTYVNTSASDFEQFTLFTDVSPNEWRNADSSRIIQVAGT